MPRRPLWIVAACLALAPATLVCAQGEPYEFTGDNGIESGNGFGHQEKIIRGRAFAWLPSLSGSLSLDNLAGFATNIDIKSDLSLGDLQTELAWDINLRLGAHNVNFSGYRFNVDSLGLATSSFDFGGVTINPGDLAETNFDALNFRILHSFSPFSIETNGFRLGPQIGLNLYDVEATVRDITFGNQDSFSQLFPIPVIGGFVEVPIGPFSIAAEASGIGLAISGIDARYFDASATLNFRPLPLVGFFGGYRYVGTDLTSSDFNVDSRLQGFFVGGEIRF